MDDEAIWVGRIKQWLRLNNKSNESEKEGSKSLSSEKKNLRSILDIDSYQNSVERGKKLALL